MAGLIESKGQCRGGGGPNIFLGAQQDKKGHGLACCTSARSIEAITRERCDDCPPGFYNNASGQSACVACSAGLYGS